MALPALTKTWQFLVNQTLTDTGSAVNDEKQSLVALTNSLTGVTSGWVNGAGASIASPTGLWQERGSSNGVSAAMLPVASAGPGTNYWTGPTSIVQAAQGTAHSWNVLRQTGIASNFEFCIDCVGSFASPTVTITVSPSAGFGSGSSAGSVTARPTATDEVTLATNLVTPPFGSSVNIRLHVLLSTDGSTTYIFICVGGYTVGMYAFVAPNAPVTGWSNPSASLAANAASATTTWPVIANLWNATPVKGLLAGTVFSAYMTGEAANGALLASFLTGPNAASGNYVLDPAAFATLTAAAAGRHGVFPDLFWGQSVLANGSGYPSGTAPTFAQFGNLVVPWPSTTISTS